MVHFSFIRPLESIVGYEVADRVEDAASDFRDNVDFAIVFRQILEDEGLVLPEIWDEGRRRGLIRSSPDIAKSALEVAGWFCGIGAVKAIYVSARKIPFSKYGKRRREEKVREKVFRDVFIKQALEKPISLVIPSASTAEPSGFFGLPPELRTKILITAFGQRTLHMSLEYQHPLYVPHERRQGYATHAGIEKLAGFEESHLRTDIPKKWIWFGCVCHRFRPGADGNVPLSFGRVGLGAEDVETKHMVSGRYEELFRGDLDLGHDLCLEGFGYCDKWEGTWPEKCHIGIMGWLLTCRQAYLEGLHVLYRTNTIQISSMQLHRSLPDILSPTVISNMTSLELVWDLAALPFDDGFISKKGLSSKDRREPLFPSMKYLRIAFAEDLTSRRYQALGIRWDLSESGLTDILIDFILPMLDKFIERSVPPTTDVTVSCLSWDWYRAIDLRLVDAQGEAQSRPQKADIGGLKILRLIPKPETNSSETGGDSSTQHTIREGIWIHAAQRDVPPRSKLSG
ncbi:unnamed protein product [Clonostachys rosea]|uniref:DUF7730 domain-containing protein n=1 Tax=Bionectria ochroleuca TaxID=29856 RepID=A0ABY6TS52_BIOOC|nr:unnamed protein product [Clonostachys rosea]